MEDWDPVDSTHVRAFFGTLETEGAASKIAGGHSFTNVRSSGTSRKSQILLRSSGRRPTVRGTCRRRSSPHDHCDSVALVADQTTPPWLLVAMHGPDAHPTSSTAVTVRGTEADRPPGTNAGQQA